MLRKFRILLLLPTLLLTIVWPLSYWREQAVSFGQTKVDKDKGMALISLCSIHASCGDVSLDHKTIEVAVGFARFATSALDWSQYPAPRPWAPGPSDKLAVNFAGIRAGTGRGDISDP